ncbi:hypothetical protein OIU78_005073 [Salix suchowensis]|nr:hypothetical protein OIU78_005073 [Salix suchowensis]
MESTAPPAEELLKKIQQLEAGHHHLQQQMTKLKLSSTSTDSKPTQQRSHSISPQRSGPRSRVAGGPTGSSFEAAWKKGSASFRHSSPLQRESRSLNSNDVRDGHSNGGGEGGDGNRGGPSVKFTDKQYLNILQSVGQSVHIFDHSGRIIYWNRTAENLYGYSEAEALGQDAFELLIDPRDYAVANGIVQRVSMGEKWTGKFPVKNKMAERFTVVATNTPLYDDGGALVGVICVSSDSQPFQGVGVALLDSRNVEAESSYSRPRNIVMNKLGLDSQQPLQKAVASKISNLVKSSPKFGLERTIWIMKEGAGTATILTMGTQMQLYLTIGRMLLLVELVRQEEMCIHLLLVYFLILMTGPQYNHAETLVMRVKVSLHFTRSLPQRQKHGLVRKGCHGPGKGMKRKAQKQGLHVLGGLGYTMIKRVKHFIREVPLLVRNLKTMSVKIIALPIMRPLGPGLLQLM